MTRPTAHSGYEIWHQGNLVSAVENTNNANDQSIYENKFNQPILIQDPKGNQTNIVYDTHGNPITITDSTGTITALQYNSRGQVTRI